MAQRARLIQLTQAYPQKVIDYFNREPRPTDARERSLREVLLEAAASAVLAGAVRL
jgi:hypothetical protein